MNIRKSIVTIAAAAALTLPLSACNEQADTQAPQTPASASQAVTEAPEAAAEGAPEVTPFGSTVTLPEKFGSQVTIKKARAGATDTYGGIEKAQSVVIFEITQKNVSSKPIDPANLLSATVDGTPAEETFGAVGENAGAPTAAIRPGQSVTWAAAYVGTMSQSWEMDLTVMPLDYDGDYNDPANFHTALFTEVG